ncbi:MAG: hypothetical protein LW855_04540 [Alphaproteobacteria bacterium]|jgi:hypothetical protein|nr:hypothetical protein [Alphaproteobacteria bacterium]
MNTFTKITTLAVLVLGVSSAAALAETAKTQAAANGTFGQPVPFELLGQPQKQLQQVVVSRAPVSREVPLSAPTATQTTRTFAPTVSSNAAEANSFRRVPQTNSFGMLLPIQDDFD